MIIESKDLKIDLDTYTCYIKDNPINTSKLEFNLLVYLLTNKNKVFSRGELSLAVWKKKLEGRTVDAAISRLRKKLAIPGKHIITKPGFGYGYIE